VSTAEAARRRHPVRKALIGLAVCMLALALVGAGSLWYLQHRLSSHIDRIDGVFDGLHDRPPRPEGEAAGAVNILLLGTDRRAEVGTTGSEARAPSWVPGAQRSDTMMVLHIDADRRGATMISIPRDSWVAVPGYGMNKVNAAFSFAGPSLAVETVERLTGVRIDHLAVIDWAGFRALTDAVGGVEVTVPRTVHDSARGITWTAGEHLLDGEQALDYVGQRYGLPRGDLDRVARQQAFLRNLMQTSLHQEMRKDPRQLFGLLDTLTRYLSVDAGWSTSSMGRLALSLRNLRTVDIQYLTAPVERLGREGDQSVVYLDRGLNRSLWSAVREDRVARWTAYHPLDVTPPVVS
jgi:LCP family protein required for cell wall assembly